jgi:ankyrin repeat protein
MKRKYGWIFFYQSKKYLKNHDPLYLLYGNAPIVVLKTNGQVHTISTSGRFERQIERFEALHIHPSYWRESKRFHYRELQYLEAIETGDLTAVVNFLAKGMPVDTKNHLDQSALYLAAKHGYTDMVTLLVDHGANINYKDCSGITPFGIAIQYDYLEIANTLLERGADITIKDSYGGTALLYAAEIESRDATLFIQKLLLLGADPKGKWDSDVNALMSAVYAGNIHSVKLFLKLGLSVTDKDDSGRCALDRVLDYEIPDQERILFLLKRSMLQQRAMSFVKRFVKSK